MNEELKALDKNQTWDLVDLLPNKRAIGCKWAYRIKYIEDGTINKYKVRLVT
jgi:hypothetical protein